MSPTGTTVAMVGVALVAALLVSTCDAYDPDDVSINEVVPEVFKVRQAVLPVVEEFEKMYDSVFMPMRYERPYDEDVLQLLMDMRKFLDQAPKLVRWLKQDEVQEVMFYSDALREPDSLTREDVRRILHRPYSAEHKPFTNRRRRQVLPTKNGHESPIQAYLASLERMYWGNSRRK